MFDWDAKSTYLLEPPLFEGFKVELPKISDVKGGRALGIYGNKLTTDHISPVAPIRKGTLAGDWLVAAGSTDLSSFGSRRTNHEVMVRGAFANPRIKNLLAPGTEGGVTIHQPSGDKMTIYEASMRYQKDGIPLFVFGGEEYGTGSSRDWAAKGTQMLGVKCVVARGYERIHRSNLVGMGVLPCQFKGNDSVQSLKIDGTETFDPHRRRRRQREAAAGPDARDPPQGWLQAERHRDAARGFADRSRILEARRHSALRPARTDGSVITK